MATPSWDERMDRGEFLKALAFLAGGSALFPFINNDQAGAEGAPQEDAVMPTEQVEYPGKTGPIRAFLARPEGDEKWPGVLVIHENRGLNPHCQPFVAQVAALWRQQAPEERNSPARMAPVQAPPQVGRNDPCPCGSGQKYKRCCGGK